MKTARVSMKTLALGGCAFGALMAAAAPAAGAEFAVSAQALQPALQEFASQGDQQVLFSSAAVAGKSTAGFSGEAAPETALQQLLSGTDLVWSKTSDGALLVMTQAEARANRPQLAQAAEAGGGSEVEALIVTAQKREEDIQDVPIAMSAFTQEDLTRTQIAGGPDLMTQVPNLTFTKTNFSSYSIQIRGIGTQAISATVDPAVAVAFNNTPFIRNRFFEQEFYDLQRVEVLRGPQGTLYGRNATAGVVNLITARPKHRFEARASADAANYGSTRLEGMVNLPLVEDKVALRLAGAWTKRDGYVTNNITGDQIDGRDLWSTRVTLGVEPTDALSAFLTWEHFEEDDDRLRSGKQLCTRQPNFLTGPSGGGAFGVNTYTSQGCKMGSLYSDEAFQVPNGFGLPYWGPLSNIGLPIRPSIDPYASTTQSRNLRVIDSTLTPEYKAKTDILHLAIEYQIGDNLTFSSETGYTADELFSFQDFNRFNTAPGVFDTSRAEFIDDGSITPDGFFCDPQLGCANRLVAADVSTARSDQFSQEFRVSSDYDGPFNFSIGANYLRYDTVDKYYVFINSLALYLAQNNSSPQNKWNPGASDGSHCVFERIADPESPDLSGCAYIDPNPIGSLNDLGRQYFLSKNPFRLISYAMFGEAQYNITPSLKLTAGIRYTVDQKHAPQVPTWILVNGYGLPTKKIIEQEWREPTGRLVLDWKPDLSFTDETLLYASYAHGYKAGGTNPPLPGAIPLGDAYGSGSANIDLIEALQPPEFGPEFIDAFEIGAKNILLDGRLTLNGNAFYYDYEGYQISQIVNRSAINLNFDAEVWGAELEADWRPFENLRLGLKVGWEKTKLGDGQGAVDMIDRTDGNADWVVIKPFPNIPSNCVLPRMLINQFGNDPFFYFADPCSTAYLLGLDPVTHRQYEANPTTEWRGNPINGYAGFNPATAPNGGWGFTKDVSGNELPNAPDFTTTLSVDYTLPLPNAWLVTLHGDFYRQSQAWARIFNEDPYDKIKPFGQINLAAIFTNEDSGWTVMAYVKNALDKDNITGAFLNSDDTGLTTNVFLNEPRLYGLRVTKRWDGGPWAGGWSGRPREDGRYPFTVELGAGSEQIDAPNERYAPAFMQNYSPDMRRGLDAQDEDLDWGDGRSVKVTYAPPGTAWTVAAVARFGRTNGTAGRNFEEPTAGGLFGPAGLYYSPFCSFNDNLSCYVEGDTNYVVSDATDREEHTIVDLSIGRDVGFGAWGGGRSTLSVGLRHARLVSSSDVRLHGMANITLPASFIVGIDATLDRITTDFRAQREFEGTGGVLSWEQAFPLLGEPDTGHLNMEWSVSGGALFGKQATDVEYSQTGGHYGFRWQATGPDGPRDLGTVDVPLPAAPTPQHRTDSVTVPVAAASLGLAYELKGVSVSAGYSWEKYFDALDVGVDMAKDADRVIQGPYLRLSFGFGG